MADVCDGRAAKAGAGVFDTTWLHACASIARLRQVLLNLVGNGVKFTEAGTVSIRVRVIESRPEAQRIEIVVKDSGIGILREDQDRLFRPFVQAETQISRHRGGTGLGLAISRRLAELMDGDLTLASEPGQATVTLSLGSTSSRSRSRRSGGGRPRAAARGRRAPGAGASWWWTTTNSTGAGSAGRPACYEPSRSDGGTRARQQGDYALILADCQMPGMDGWPARAVRRAEADDGAGAHPIVAWTANVCPTTWRRARCRDGRRPGRRRRRPQRMLRTWVDHAGETIRMASLGL